MGKKQRMWAKKARAKLMLELGSACAECGVTGMELEMRPPNGKQIILEFDCIEGRGDDHHRGNAEARMIFYRKEHSQKNIQILCTTCNARKGLAVERRAQNGAYEQEPF
jgi:5-methylcytosine-specific restriction endonuclease McrA